MNKQELQKQIQALQRQMEGISSAIDDLKQQAENMQDDDVPEMLLFDYGDACYHVNVYGDVSCLQYREDKNHMSFHLCGRNRLFKTREMAELFEEKTQFIADCLLWKQLYDRDYVPDWNDGSGKCCVMFNHSTDCYEAVINKCCDYCTIYFSTVEIAKKCADWLNSQLQKKDEPDENSIPF